MTSSSSSINEAAGIKGMSLFLSFSPLFTSFFMLVIIESTSTTQGIWAEDSLVADLLEAFLKIPEEPLGEKLKNLRVELNKKKIAYEGVTVRMYRFGSEKDPQVDAAIKKFIDDPLQQLKSGKNLLLSSSKSHLLSFLFPSFYPT